MASERWVLIVGTERGSRAAAREHREHVSREVRSYGLRLVRLKPRAEKTSETKPAPLTESVAEARKTLLAAISIYAPKSVYEDVDRVECSGRGPSSTGDARCGECDAGGGK